MYPDVSFFVSGHSLHYESYLGVSLFLSGMDKRATNPVCACSQDEVQFDKWSFLKDKCRYSDDYQRAHRISIILRNIKRRFKAEPCTFQDSLYGRTGLSLHISLG